MMLTWHVVQVKEGSSSLPCQHLTSGPWETAPSNATSMALKQSPPPKVCSLANLDLNSSVHAVL